MAIKTCEDCGKKYSDNAPSCPHCSSKSGSQPASSFPAWALVLIITLLSIQTITGFVTLREVKNSSLIGQAKQISAEIDKNVDNYNKIALSNAKLLKSALQLYYVNNGEMTNRVDEILAGDKPLSAGVLAQVDLADDGFNFAISCQHTFGSCRYTVYSENEDVIEELL